MRRNVTGPVLILWQFGEQSPRPGAIVSNMEGSLGMPLMANGPVVCLLGVSPARGHPEGK